MHDHDRKHKIHIPLTEQNNTKRNDGSKHVYDQNCKIVWRRNNNLSNEYLNEILIMAI